MTFQYLFILSLLLIILDMIMISCVWWLINKILKNIDSKFNQVINQIEIFTSNIVPSYNRGDDDAILTLPSSNFNK